MWEKIDLRIINKSYLMDETDIKQLRIEKLKKLRFMSFVIVREHSFKIKIHDFVLWKSYSLQHQ